VSGRLQFRMNLTSGGNEARLGCDESSSTPTNLSEALLKRTRLLYFKLVRV
jgi:hypothetical protein